MTCAHGMPSPASCIYCMDDVGLGSAPVETATVQCVFTASYDGHCTGCDLGIHVGQRIAAMSDGRYVHSECA